MLEIYWTTVHAYVLVVRALKGIYVSWPFPYNSHVGTVNKQAAESSSPGDGRG